MTASASIGISTPWESLKVWGDLARWHASIRANDIAFEDLHGQCRSFSEFDHRVDALNGAVARLGVTKGDRVAILSRNCIEYVETYGLGRTGIIAVPLNWRLTASELARLLAHSRPVAIVVDAADREVAEAIRPMANEFPELKYWIAIGFSGEGWIDYETLMSAGDPAPAVDISPDDPFCIMYTSGTTGFPKGVTISHKGVLGNARISATTLSLVPEDRTLAAMPMFHVGGMWYHLHASYAAGARSVVMAGFDPVGVLSELESRRITNVHLVPTMVAAILELPQVTTANLSSLRLIFYAASPMPFPTLRKAIATFPNCGFIQSYGSTEAGMLTSLSPSDHAHGRSLTSCGRAITGVELEVIGTDGEPLARGDIGDVMVRNDYPMLGYWLDPEATKRTMADGWLRMGDMGRLDPAGYLELIDRRNDMIVTGGENVYPSEVEAALLEDPAIQSAAVFGIPDPLWVEKVIAAVVPRAGARLDAAQVITRVRTRLAPYKCPKEINIVETLPMSTVGKVLRKELRTRFGKTETNQG